jgi:hypothetical protein
MTTPVPTAGRSLPAPFVAIVGYTIRACLPIKRWFGVLAPCLLALLFGLLTSVTSESSDAADFGDIAEAGLFRLILPLTCLIIGDAVLGADVRAGTFQLTWLSPAPFSVITAGRWLGGWMVALVSVVPALALAAMIAGVPDAAGPIAMAAVWGSAAYIALFMLVAACVRRSALWSLAIVLIGEWLLGTNLAAVAGWSPLWQSMQTFAGLWDEGWRIERDGMPTGWSAVARLLLITVACLALTAWRMGRMRPIGGDD